MADPLHRLKLELLYPPFVSRLRQALEECDTLGATYVATRGARSFTEQATLYFQGRTMPGKIVTQARAGYSAHNYGLAVDFCRFFDDVPSWETQDYETLGEACERAGLAWGHRFSHDDPDHIQWPGYVTGLELESLRTVYLASGMPVVWAHVTANSPTFPSLTLPKGSTT